MRPFAITNKTGLSLSHGLAAARAIYGSHYNGALTLKALCFLQDGNVMTLPDEVKRDLTVEVKNCDLARIPKIVPQGIIGEGTPQDTSEFQP